MHVSWYTISIIMCILHVLDLLQTIRNHTEASSFVMIAFSIANCLWNRLQFFCFHIWTEECDICCLIPLVNGAKTRLSVVANSRKTMCVAYRPVVVWVIHFRTLLADGTEFVTAVTNEGQSCSITLLSRWPT